MSLRVVTPAKAGVHGAARGGGTADASIHKAEKSALKAIVVIEGGQLVSHPVETGVFGASACTSAHKVDDFVSTVDLRDSLHCELCPVLRILVVILNRVRAIPKLGVKGQVLAEVVHPASTATLLDQVLLDDVFEPSPSLWVSEVDHGEPDAETVDQKGVTVLIFNKVAVFASLGELILSDALDLARVLNVGVDVDEGAHAVLSPVTDHVVPVVVPVLLELPVPNESRALLVRVLTDPVLHPNADHGQLKLLHLGILLVDEFLSANDADNSALQGPLRKGRHGAYGLAELLG